MADTAAATGTASATLTATPTMTALPYDIVAEPMGARSGTPPAPTFPDGYNFTEMDLWSATGLKFVIETWANPDNTDPTDASISAQISVYGGGLFAKVSSGKIKMTGNKSSATASVFSSTPVITGGPFPQATSTGVTVGSDNYDIKMSLDYTDSTPYGEEYGARVLTLAVAATVAKNGSLVNTVSAEPVIQLLIVKK